MRIGHPLGLLTLLFTFAGCAGNPAGSADTSSPPADGPGARQVEACNVVWTTPSTDAAGSMPLGNGEVGLSLWVEPEGDLRFYIARSDAYSEISRLLKVGGVRVSLTPNPFAHDAPFRQELRLRDGVCHITAGQADRQVTLRIWVDADQPVIHITGESAAGVAVKVAADTWRTERHELTRVDKEQISAWTMQGAPFPLAESADLFVPNLPDAVAWYHRNEESCVESTIKVQGLEPIASLVKDPLIHRTFGGLITGPSFTPQPDGRALANPAARSFAVRIAVPCAQTPSADAWLQQARRLAAASANPQTSRQRTAAWWQAFWDRSWVVVSGSRAQEAPLVDGGHPLRIGYDSNRQNPFPGQIARVGIYGRALTDAEIRQLAAADRTAAAPVQAGLLLAGDGKPREIPHEQVNLRQGMTLEAWILPERNEPGRIFDKITASGSDGFLFDTHPGDTLRFIFGRTKLSAEPGTLRIGQWQHAAATLDPRTGAVRVYLNGRQVAQHGADAAGDASPAVSPITRGYTLQRYMQACGGRGTLPIKFNGGIFTVEPKAMGKPHNADWRAWGDCHWFQNVRHMYHPMLASGDVEMTDPFFDLYERVRPLCEARARLYHNVEGCYFPETMTIWGTYSNRDYGWNRSGHQPNEVLCQYWRYAWNQGPELVALLLDRWDYTGDEIFLRQRVLPMAASVLRYFDTRFMKENKIVLTPTQAVETYWFDVVNDAPTVAGLNAICRRLTALPERLTTAEQRAFFARMLAACPPVPVEEKERDGQKIRKLAPAEKYMDKTSNCENPELYAVWPFALYGVGRAGLEEAKAAYAMRRNHLPNGWGYDGNCAAVLGLADEAGRILQGKCANSHAGYRWPATWGPNFDWLPDQNHGGNLLETMHLMLLQPVGEKLYLLPAWPRGWDVSFKLHAPRQTVVECVYRSGKVVDLKVTPEARRGDIVLPSE